MKELVELLGKVNIESASAVSIAKWYFVLNLLDSVVRCFGLCSFILILVFAGKWFYVREKASESRK